MKSGGAPIDGGTKGAEASVFISGGTDGVFELGGGAPIEKGLCCCNAGAVGGGGSSGFNDAAGGPATFGGGGKAALLEPDNEELLALLQTANVKNDQNW